MPAEKTQPFCPCSRVLNWTGKGFKTLVKFTWDVGGLKTKAFGTEVCWFPGNQISQ